MGLRSPLVVVVVALALASSLTGCTTTERNDDTIACPRPVSFHGRLYRQVGTATGQAVGQRLGPAELHTCTMPDGTDLDPLPVVFYDVRTIGPRKALAVKSEGRWTVFAPYDARGTSHCSLPGIRCHHP